VLLLRKTTVMKRRWRWGSRRAFLATATIGLLISAVQPAVAAWVACGLVVALAAALWALRPWSALARARGHLRPIASWVINWIRRHRVAIGIVAGTIVVFIAIIATIGLSMRGGSSMSSRTGVASGSGYAANIGLAGEISAAADYATRQHAFDVTERLTISGVDLAAAASSPLLQKPIDVHQLAAWVISGLSRERWQVQPLSTAGVSALLRTTAPVRAHDLFPGLERDTLALAAPGSLPGPMAGGIRLSITVNVAPSSTLSMNTPTYLVAQTDPPSTAASIPGTREIRRLALDGATTVSYEVRSVAFQNELLAAVTDLTLWSPLKWILALVVAASSEELRDAVSSRLRRLLQRQPREEAPPLEQGAGAITVVADSAAPTASPPAAKADLQPPL